MVEDRDKAILAYFIDDELRLARVSLVTRDDCSIIKHTINEQIQISYEDHTDNEMLDAIEKVMSDKFMFRKEIPAFWLGNKDLSDRYAWIDAVIDAVKMKMSGKWRRI